jgi:hypothetical protein
MRDARVSPLVAVRAVKLDDVALHAVPFVDGFFDLVVTTSTFEHDPYSCWGRTHLPLRTD